jgi:hypothetical protein
MKLNLAILLLISILLIALVYSSYIDGPVINEGLNGTDENTEKTPLPILPKIDNDFNKTTGDLINKDNVIYYLNTLVDYVESNDININNINASMILPYLKAGADNNPNTYDIIKNKLRLI